MLNANDLNEILKREEGVKEQKSEPVQCSIEEILALGGGKPSACHSPIISGHPSESERRRGRASEASQSNVL